jgi:hypothetical protein
MNPEHELESYKQQIGKKHALEQMVAGFRDQGFQLKKKLVRFEQVEQVLHSEQYAHLLREAAFKARELEMLEAERKALQGDWTEHRLQKLKLDNEVMRDRLEELEYLNQIEKERTKRLLRQFEGVDADL